MAINTGVDSSKFNADHLTNRIDQPASVASPTDEESQGDRMLAQTHDVALREKLEKVSGRTGLSRHADGLGSQQATSMSAVPFINEPRLEAQANDKVDGAQKFDKFFHGQQVFLQRREDHLA